jgi:hypothetical protein
MKFHLLLAGALCCLSFGVAAAECEFPFDATVAGLVSEGNPVNVIDPIELPEIVEAIETMIGADFGAVTRGFFAEADGKILLGLEVDACLLPPINLGLAPASEQLSGKDATGRVGA